MGSIAGALLLHERAIKQMLRIRAMSNPHVFVYRRDRPIIRPCVDQEVGQRGAKTKFEIDAAAASKGEKIQGVPLGPFIAFSEILTNALVNLQMTPSGVTPPAAGRNRTSRGRSSKLSNAVIASTRTPASLEIPVSSSFARHASLSGSSQISALRTRNRRAPPRRQSNKGGAGMQRAS